MSASSNFLQQVLPTGTTTSKTNPVGTSKTSASAQFLQAVKAPVGGLSYVPTNTTQTPAPAPKATLGSKVVGFAKGLANDAVNTLLVTPAARATEAITRTLAPNSLAAKGYEASADQPQTFNIPLINKLTGQVTVAPQKAFGQGGGEQIAGQALHAAAYLAPYGKIADALGGAAVGASKLTPAILKTAKTVGNIGAGAIAGGAFGAGSSLEQGQSAGEVAKNTLINAGLGAAIPAALEGAGRLLKGKAKVPVDTAVPTPETPVNASVPKTDAQGFRPVQPGEVLPNGYTTKMNVKTGEQMTNAPIKENPTINQTPEFHPQTGQQVLKDIPIEKQTPEFVNKVKQDTSSLDKSFPENIGENTHEAKASAFNLDYFSNPKLAEQYATGEILHPKGPAYNTAYNALLKNEASRSGDMALLDRVTNVTSNVIKSTAGQNLESLRLLDKGSVGDILTTIKRDLATNFEKRTGKNITTDFQKFSEDFSKKINELKAVPTREDIISIVDEICK